MKIKTHLLFISICSFYISHGQLANATASAEALLNELSKTYPGLSAAVGYGNEILWKQGVGYANVANRVEVDPDHQFRYYSLSKSITGMALIKLIGEGKLDIEKSVTYYLEELPDAYDNVKVKHLINHTAGVRHYSGGEWMKISGDHCADTRQAIETFVGDPLESEPGQKHSYSSFGYVLLSHLISVISDEPFNSYIQKNFLDPLEIKNMRPDQSEFLSKQVSYYSKWNAAKTKGTEAKSVNNSCKFGGGGFVGTAEAIVKLHLAMANEFFVKKELLDQYYTAIPDEDEKSSYAFGIGDNISSSSGRRYHAHTGSALGANSVLIVYEPDETFPKPMVAVILGNIKDSEMNKHIGNLASFFIEEIESQRKD